MTVAGLLLVAAFGARAQDVRYVAANCANCHGTEGRSAGGIPPLAGIDAGFFLEQMKAFRSGQRRATIMHQIVNGYTDQQVADLARYFSALRPQ
jgi:cytochrome c553